MTENKEGKLYKAFEINGVYFEIYYGYETESERRRGWDPTPIYPNFTEQPQYTSDGIPFTLAYGSPCRHYEPIDREEDDDWCANCPHFDQREEFIGLCGCMHNRIQKNE